MTELAVGIADVEAAADRIRGRVVDTPCIVSETLSEIHGCRLILKFENLQYTAAFKDRGACNCLLQLDDAAKAKGVIAASAGNHAQAVAHHARLQGIKAVIVMPRHTPFVKVANTERLGARIVLEGETVDDAMAHARTLAAAEGYTLIHPFDDARVIAGQGTIGLEMMTAFPELDVLVVPIGGGGLISGIAIAAKHANPDLRIIGVEAALYPSVQRLRDGLPAAAGGATIADGIAVKQPGKLTLPIIEHLVDDVLLVEEADIEAAILQLLEIEKTVVEGAGAAALAAVAKVPERWRGQNVGIVLCGGNIDPRLLSAVILRGLVTSSRLVQLVVEVPDLPGHLAAAATAVADLGANIVDVTHRREFSALSVKSTEITFTVETKDAQHAAKLIAGLEAQGLRVRRLRPGRF
ncbi:MAG: threonine ammonia-lyase [Geminicoccaceae bacterium]|nr:MAG: threonine ammonia-lyase [Geminicoccaceae bacterium]